MPGENLFCTAVYVAPKIKLEFMNQKGLYEDRQTEIYIKDVIHNTLSMQNSSI